MVEDDHAVGHAAHDAQVVLDDQHRQVELLTQAQEGDHRVVLLLDGHAGGRLVEQEQRGLGGQRPRHLDQLLHAVGQRAHRLVAVGLEVEEVHQLLGLAPLRDLVPGPPGSREQGVEQVGPHVHVPAEEQVLQARHVLEELDVLEAAADAQLGHPLRRQARDVATAPPHAPRLGAVEAADDVEDARLARAVRPDERRHLALVEGEADGREGGQAPEVEGDAGELEDGGHAARGRRARYGPPPALVPRGSASRRPAVGPAA